MDAQGIEPVELDEWERLQVEIGGGKPDGPGFRHAAADHCSELRA